MKPAYKVAIGVAISAIGASFFFGPTPREAVTLLKYSNDGAPPSAMTLLTERDPVSSSLPIARLAPPESWGRAPDKPKSEEVKRLFASANPSDKLEGYKMIEECLETRDAEELLNESMPKARRELCGDLNTELGTQRVEYLKEAALAGVHRAWWKLYINERPEGRWPTLPDTADTKELLAAAYKAALATGDPVALLYESGQAEKANDRPRALALWVAFRESFAADSNQLSFNPAQDTDTKRLSAGLAPEVAAAAIASGRTYIASTRTKK